MVDETEEEEAPPPEEEEDDGGGRFSLPMAFEDAVDALLRVKPEKQRGKKEAPPEGGADPSGQPED